MVSETSELVTLVTEGSEESQGTAANEPVKNARGEFLDNLSRVVIVLGLYVASIGPMYWPWVHAKYLNGYRFIAVLYEPLFQLAGLVPPFGRWLNWYISLWIY